VLSFRSLNGLQSSKRNKYGKEGLKSLSFHLLGEGSKVGTDPSPQLRESYMQCSDQQALSLIFSDEKAYYLLCKSVENSDMGYVFEVRRGFGLSSVRFVSAGGHE